MNKIYRGKGGHFATKAEKLAQIAAEGQTQSVPAARKEVIAYKGFNLNDKGEMFCKSHTFELGKEYDLTNTVPVNSWSSTKRKTASLCNFGFHACENPFDMFSYYPFSPDRAYGRVTLFGHMDRGSVYEHQDKIAALGIRVDEVINVHHLINLLAKFARDNPTKVPTNGSVTVNDDLVKDSAFQIATTYAYRHMTNAHSKQYECPTQFHAVADGSMTTTNDGTQISTQSDTTIVALCQATQYSFGDRATHILHKGGNVVVKGAGSRIVANESITFRGPKGTRFDITPYTDRWGRPVPGVSGVIGENDIPADKDIRYAMHEERTVKAKLVF